MDARAKILAALAASDANGSYTDEDCDAEGLPRWTCAAINDHIAMLADEKGILYGEMLQWLGIRAQWIMAVKP